MKTFVEELANLYMTARAGLDYDGLQFAIGTVDAEFELQVVTLFTDDLSDIDDKFIVFSVPVVRRWVNTYGRNTATTMTAFAIAHNMGLMKNANRRLVPSYDFTVYETTEETMAVSDAYARAVLGDMSKEDITTILSNVLYSTVDKDSISIWKKAVLDTKIESRVDKMVAKKYMWQDAPNLEDQIYTWSELVVSLCKDVYIERV